jgi:hypothetical protein
LAAGPTESFTGASSVQISSDATGAITVGTGASTIPTWIASIKPKTGSTIIADGTYPTALTPDAGDLGFTLSDGFNCSTETGTLNVLDIAYSGTDVTSFAANYSTVCNGTGTVTGVLRYNSATGYVGATQSVSSIDYGTIDIGQPTAANNIVVSSVGSQSLTIGKVAFSGTNEDSYYLTADTCSGKTIAGGSSCTISVVADAFVAGSNVATLTIPDNTARKSRTVSLVSSGQDNPLGTYQAVSPFRLLDTRNGTGAPQQVVGPKGVVALQVTDRGGASNVPAGASAVVLNVTETGATTGGYITAYPAGTTRPAAGSNINFPANRTEANSVTVKIGTGGVVDIYNNAGNVNIIADVSGYFAGDNSMPSAGQYQALGIPSRIWDTRHNGANNTALPLASHQIQYINSTYVDGNNVDLDPHVRALVVNITAVTPTKSGYLTAWQGDTDTPATSTVNFPAGSTVPNMAIVPTGVCPVDIYGSECDPYGQEPFIAIYNGSTGPVNFIVDVVGFFDDGTVFGGMRFHAEAPTRIVDSRIGQGISKALTKGKTAAVTPPTTVGDYLTGAFALNVTAVSPTSSTYLSLWPDDGSGRPITTTLNPAAKQTVANAAVTAVGNNNAFNVYNNAGTANVVIDVDGWYDYYPPSAGITARHPLGANAIKSAGSKLPTAKGGGGHFAAVAAGK